MPHLARYIALAACLALTGSVADAAPGRRDGRHRKLGKKKAKHRSKALREAKRKQTKALRARADENSVRDFERIDDDDRIARDERPARRKADEDETDDEDADDDDADDDEHDDDDGDDRPSDEVAFASPDDDDDTIVIRDDDGDALVESQEQPRKQTTKARDWNVGIGPYVWASSVDANVSLGSSSVSAGIDFFDLQRNTRFGAQVLAEARYRRFSLVGDMTYGLMDVKGAREIGPFMVAVDGSVSSLMVDGAAGYLLAGNGHSLVSLEVRGGIRYQRTAIAGSVLVAGSALTPPEKVMAGSDALAGTRVFVRPHPRFFFTGAGDYGLFGSSASTWSVSVDASVRATSFLLVSLGWRRLTTDSAYVSVVMHGPRLAVQFVF